MTAFISPLAADIIGICGSVLFIIGFAYANLAKAMDQLLFNALNLGGAALLLISLSVHFNLAAVVLEVAWGAIALAGVVRALWVRRIKPLPRAGEGGVDLSENAGFDSLPPPALPASGRGEGA